MGTVLHLDVFGAAESWWLPGCLQGSGKLVASRTSPGQRKGMAAGRHRIERTGAALPQSAQGVSPSLVPAHRPQSRPDSQKSSLTHRVIQIAKSPLAFKIKNKLNKE